MVYYCFTLSHIIPTNTTKSQLFKGTVKGTGKANKMARITQPLTTTEIEKAKPKEKIYKLMDGEGLHLKVRPTGAKIWALSYKHPITKKEQTLTIGRYPEISLRKARELKLEYKSLLAQKIDPKKNIKDEEQKKIIEIENTFFNIASKWYEWRKTRENFSPKYAKEVWRMFEMYIFPTFKNTPITELKANEVIDCLFPLAQQKKLSTLHRIVQLLNEIMKYSIHRGIISFNPIESIGKEFDRPVEKHYPAIKPTELPELLKVIQSDNIKLDIRRMFMWQLLTMTRPNETATAKFSDIDEAQGLWTIIINKGNKRGREHIVTLSKQALQILNDIKQDHKNNGIKSDYLFPSPRNLNKHRHKATLNRILINNGFRDRCVAHGFRSIASTHFNELGRDFNIVEVALSHLNGDKVRQAYNRAKYISRRRELLQEWADYIDACSNKEE